MNTSEFRYGFRVLGDCRQPRRLVDAGTALAAYAACDERAEPRREAYLSAFWFDADFRARLAVTGSTAGFAGACWAPWIWWDVDAEGNIELARDHARRLAVTITEQLGIVEDDLLCFFSGSKGFHLGVPTATWAPEPGRDFHKTAKRFAESIAERAGATIDTGVYDRVRCFRAPNSRHPKTRLHKRWLAFNDLMHLRTDAILQLAGKPEPFDLPAPTYRSESAVAVWADAAEHVQREAEAKAAKVAKANGSTVLNRSTLQFIRDGATAGDRHRLLYSASANLAELGAPLPLCTALLTEAALDVGLPPADVRRAIENGWASVVPGVRDACDAFAGQVTAVQSSSGTSSKGDTA